jgi:signal transduction histidine kinase
VPPDHLLEDLEPALGLSASSASRLRALHAAAGPQLRALAATIAASVIDAEAQRLASQEGMAASLAGWLAGWLDRLLLGPPGAAAAASPVRAVAALAEMRSRLAALVEELLAHDQEARRETAAALHQRLDLELAVLLAAAREDGADRRLAAERLSVIGELAAGIGHELRQPLAIIESSLHLARRQLAQLGVADPALEHQLDKIGAEVSRSNKTIADLLGLARNQPPRRQPLDLAAVVARALARLPAPAGVRLDVEVAPDVTTHADPDQLAQVVANLVLNAFQALGGRGQITVQGRRHGEGTWLRVRDDGPGVPPELRHRVFEPLFSTRPQGNGLGLALCRRIAEAHGGTLVLEATATGASFVLTLPEAAP